MSSGDNGLIDLLDDFIGVRAIKILLYLLTALVILHAVGIILAILHGVHFLQTTTDPFVRNVDSVIIIAGVIATILTIYRVISR